MTHESSLHEKVEEYGELCKLERKQLKSMAGFTKLFHSITTSSIWNTDDKTRIVWVTMLALCDPDGIVRASVGGLAHASRVSKEDCQKSLDVLLAPDDDSRSEEFEGRRIEKVDGGFLVLNYLKYRECRDEEDRKEYMREYMRGYRKQRKLPLTIGKSCKPQLAKEEAEAEEYTDPQFCEFWENYPRKVGKEDAWKAWLKMSPKPHLTTLLHALKLQVPLWARGQKKYTPHASKWLNAKRWQDEVEEENANEVIHLPPPRGC